jgi:uncharacterized protein YkwD
MRQNQKAQSVYSMRRKLGPTLFIAAVLLVLAPFSAQRVCSQQDSGVAGDARVSRGVASGTRGAVTRPRSVETADTSDDVSTPRISSRRIREIESLEQQCLDEVNKVRRARHLLSLHLHQDLLSVARGYSRRMAEQHFFSHEDPEGRTVRERVDQADIKWRIIGENLAYSTGYVNPVAASLRGWMESPGHRRNILDPDYTLTAIGVWIDADGTVYFTEIFIKQ